MTPTSAHSVSEFQMRTSLSRLKHQSPGNKGLTAFGALLISENVQRAEAGESAQVIMHHRPHGLSFRFHRVVAGVESSQ